MIEAKLSADLVLVDLGFSSNQISDPSRGFSFANDGPLDMRLDPTAPLTAADLVNSLPESELSEIIAEFGEDPASAKIARKLVQERRLEPITTTSRLADLVRSSRGPHHDRSAIDPATKTFQALTSPSTMSSAAWTRSSRWSFRGALEVKSGVGSVPATWPLVALARGTRGGDRLPFVGRPPRQANVHRTAGRRLGPNPDPHANHGERERTPRQPRGLARPNFV